MTRNLTRFLCPAALALALSLPAAAAPDGAQMELDIVRQGDGMVAVVVLQHVLGAYMELDLTYTVNGQVVKVDPVQIWGPTAHGELLGRYDEMFSVCASIEGDVQIVGDQWHPTEHERCAVYVPPPPLGMLLGTVPGRTPGIRAPRPGSPEPIDRREFVRLSRR